MADSAALQFEFDARFDKLFKVMSTLEAKVVSDLKKMDGTFQRANKKVVDTLNESGTAFSKFTRLTGAQRFVLQSTTAQFGDLAVQIAGGTSPMRAMSQQLPQLFGGFSALGGALGIVGPLLGTVAAIGLPLASFFIGMSAGSQDAASKAETLADKTKLLKDATDSYLSAAKESKATIAELRVEYADLADEVKRGLDIQTELTRKAQERAQTLTAGGAASAVTGNLPGLLTPTAVDTAIKGYDALIQKREQLAAAYLDALVNPTSTDGGAALGIDLAKVDAAIAMLDSVKSRLEELAAQYGLTTEQTQRLTDAAAALNQADPGRAQVEAASQLQAVLIDIFGSAEAVDQKFSGVLATLQSIVVEGAKAAQQTDDAGILAGLYRDALDQASSVLDGMAGKYGPIIANIEAAAKAAWNLAQATAAAVPAGSVDDAGNPTQFGLGSAARRPPRKPVTNIDFGDKPAKSGGGGGGSTLNKQEAADLAKKKSLFEATRTAAEKYKIEQDEINRLFKSGKIDADLFDRAMAQLNEKYGAGAELMKGLEEAGRSAFVNLVTGAESFGDALSNLLAKLAEMAANAAFDILWNGKPPSGGSGSGGGGLSAILKSIFSFDGGGTTGAGARSGGLDGKGGFLAMLHPRETVIDHTKGQGSGGVVLNVNVIGATGNGEIRDMVNSGISTAMRGYDRKVLPGRFQAISRDARRRD